MFLVILLLEFSHGLGDNRTEDRLQLFNGSNAKDRFGECLRRVLQSLTENELNALGCPAAEVGAYSLRKGSTSSLAGCPGGPSSMQIMMRMGHSLGKLNDRYISQDTGGDQLCGRLLSGLPITDHRFSTLPVHFDASVAQYLTIDVWNEIVPGYENYPEQFRSMFPLLVAAVIHHEAELRQRLDPTHPILNSTLFIRNRVLDKMHSACLNMS